MTASHYTDPRQRAALPVGKSVFRRMRKHAYGERQSELPIIHSNTKWKGVSHAH